MADVSYMLTCVVLVTSFIACWAKTLTPHGTCYIFHVPFINGYPRLLLVTVSTRPIKVNLTLTHQHGLSAVLTLQKAEVTIYDINPEFLFAESGLTNAFILESKEEFGARVVLTDSLRYPSMLASFNLVPSKGFGQLYLVSAISDKPAIVVVNGHKITFVTIALRGGSYSYSAGNSLLNDRFHMALLPHHAFFLQNKCLATQARMSITGSQIWADEPIGVIVGTCMSKVTDCQTDTFVTDDFAAEMLLPVDSLSKFYHLVELSSRAKSVSYEVMALYNETSFHVHVNEAMPHQETFLDRAGDSVIIKDTMSVPQLLRANKNVAVFVIVYAACEQGTGGPSFSVLVPVAMYITRYTWVTQEMEGFREFAFIIFKRNLVELMHNKKWLPIRTENNTNLTDVAGDPDFSSLRLTSSPGFNDLINAAGTKFGMYLYGEIGQHGYLTFGGYLPAHLTQNCTRSPSKRHGDGKDNDCDGWVDEEQENRMDDDNDDRVDEDLGLLATVDGQWGPWQVWTCPRPCGKYWYKIRRRMCNDPTPQSGGEWCHGDESQTIDEVCDTTITCPEDCPYQTFDVNCTKRCNHCVSDCSRITGECPVCHPGWTSSEAGCNKECPEGTYGFACSYSCYEKCDTDCGDRATGMCIHHSSAQDLVLYMLMVIAPMVCILPILAICRRRKVSEEPEVELVVDVSYFRLPEMFTFYDAASSVSGETSSRKSSDGCKPKLKPTDSPKPKPKSILKPVTSTELTRPGSPRVQSPVSTGVYFAGSSDGFTGKWQGSSTAI